MTIKKRCTGRQGRVCKH